MSTEQHTIPEAVLAGLRAVRETAAVNMMDIVGVQQVANQIGEHALVVWIEELPRPQHERAAIYLAALEAMAEEDDDADAD